MSTGFSTCEIELVAMEYARARSRAPPEFKSRKKQANGIGFMKSKLKAALSFKIGGSLKHVPGTFE